MVLVSLFVLSAILTPTNEELDFSLARKLIERLQLKELIKMREEVKNLEALIKACQEEKK